MSLYQSARYAAESVSYYPKFVRELESQDLDPAVTSMIGGRHTGNVGAAVSAAALYDIMSETSRNSVTEERDKVRFIAGMSMWYFDLIDDASDQTDIYLEPDQKREALVTVAANSLEPMSLSPLPDSRFYRAAFHLGRNVREVIGGDPVAITYRDSVANALETELKAVDRLHLEGLLDYAINIGRACGGVLAGSVEYVRGETDEPTLQAAQGLCVYGELLDHAYEINEDLQNGATTFATEMIYLHGDSWKARKDAREVLLGQANFYRRWGRNELTRRQQRIYEGIANLYDLRYKVIVNFRDYRLGKKYKDFTEPALSH